MSRHSKSAPSHPLGTKARGAGVIVEQEHDPYRARGKLPEPTVCPDCGAVFQDGRWAWLSRPHGAHEDVCPACHRMRDHFPAGYLTIEGEYFRSHREEVLGVVRNRAERAKAEHPLERIMAIEEQGDGLLITTTEPHLARGLGTALHDAFHGELDFRHEAGENLLRAHWKR